MKKISKGIIRSIGFGLRIQMGISFMLMSIIVLMLSAALTYFGMLSILQKQSEDNTMQLFEQVNHTINAFRQEVDKISTQLLSTPQVQDYLDQNLRVIGEADRIQLNIDVLNQMDVLLGNYNYLDSVFIYTEDGKVLGNSLFRILLPPNASKQQQLLYFSNLKRTSVYSEAKESFPKLVWAGANQIADFTDQTSRSKKGEKNIISAARAVKSVTQSTSSATLIINIHEKSLLSLYNNLTKNFSGELYISDQNGQIISHADQAHIGTISTNYASIQSEKTYGSFRLNDKQIIYLKLGDTGWTLIKEIPIAEFVKDILNLKSIIIWILLISLLVTFFMSSFWIRKIMRPLYQLTAAMRTMEMGDVGYIIPKHSRNEFGMLSRGFNRMSESIVQSLERDQRNNEEKRRLEIQILQSHINPHFLFNTLNTIKWTATVMKAGNIVEIINALGNMLRPIFKNPATFYTLEEELEYIQNYMKIMNNRYGEGIVIQYHIPDSLLTCLVPRFILQPLIENALMHGLETNHYVGVIEIIVNEMDDENFNIQVKDSGIGIPIDKLQRLNEWIRSTDSEQASLLQDNEFGIGLLNIQRRIKLHFGISSELQVHSITGHGTTIEIRIPQNRKINNIA